MASSLSSQDGLDSSKRNQDVLTSCSDPGQCHSELTSNADSMSMDQPRQRRQEEDKERNLKSSLLLQLDDGDNERHLAAQNRMAEMCMTQNNVRKAVEIFENIFISRQNDPAYGDSHPVTMQSRWRYLNAKFYLVFDGGCGDVEEAIGCFEECFQLKKRLDRLKHTRNSDFNYEMTEEEIEITEKVHRARVNGFRAIFLLKQKRIDEAYELYGTVFQTFYQFLGPQNPETLHSFKMGELLWQKYYSEQEMEDDFGGIDRDDEEEGSTSHVNVKTMAERLSKEVEAQKDLDLGHKKESHSSKSSSKLKADPKPEEQHDLAKNFGNRSQTGNSNLNSQKDAGSSSGITVEMRPKSLITEADLIAARNKIFGIGKSNLKSQNDFKSSSQVKISLRQEDKPAGNSLAKKCDNLEKAGNSNLNVNSQKGFESSTIGQPNAKTKVSLTAGEKHLTEGGNVVRAGKFESGGAEAAVATSNLNSDKKIKTVTSEVTSSTPPTPPQRGIHVKGKSEPVNQKEGPPQPPLATRSTTTDKLRSEFLFQTPQKTESSSASQRSAPTLEKINDPRTKLEPPVGRQFKENISVGQSEAAPIPPRRKSGPIDNTVQPPLTSNSPIGSVTEAQVKESCDKSPRIEVNEQLKGQNQVQGQSHDKSDANAGGKSKKQKNCVIS